jgi:hypothetical protein
MPEIRVVIDEDDLPADTRASAKLAARCLQDLFTWAVEHKQELEFQGFFVQALQDQVAMSNARQMLARLQSVLLKAAANVSGYQKELELASKYLNKTQHASLVQAPEKRSIHFGARGDLAVDYGGGFGKAIQSKSCFSAAYADVDAHIKKAALQLTGEKVQAETPAAGDRRVLDISIRNGGNTWPATNAFITPAVNDVATRVHKYVTEYTANLKGYNKWGELTYGLTNQKSGGKGTAVVYQNMTTGQNVMGIDFVTKIRWDPPRQFASGPKRLIVTRTHQVLNTMNWVTEIIREV